MKSSFINSLPKLGNSYLCDYNENNLFPVLRYPDVFPYYIIICRDSGRSTCLGSYNKRALRLDVRIVLSQMSDSDINLIDDITFLSTVPNDINLIHYIYDPESCRLTSYGGCFDLLAWVCYVKTCISCV